jgi:hypothetical protein
MSTMDSITKAQTIGGCAVLGALITGIAALSFAFRSSSPEGVGIALLAAAVAFVGVANVVFRK